MQLNTEFTVEYFVSDIQFQKWVVSNKQIHTDYWKEWLQTYPHHSTMMTEAAVIVHQLQFKPQVLSETVIESEWQQLQKNINQTSQPKIRRFQFIKYAVAAIFIGLLAFTAFFYSNNETIIVTNYGENKTIILADGSMVVLNANSILKYSESIVNQKVREVTLEGEAFFDVEHKADKRPFVVHSSSFDVNVLGTSFNVINRAEKIRVVLKTGKVQVDLKNQVLVETTASEQTQQIVNLEPGEWLESKDKSYIKQSVNTLIYTSWKNNLLTFDNTSIQELARILKDNYGVDVIIEDKTLLKDTLTGRIPSDKLTALLKAITLSFQIDVIQKDAHTIILKRQKKDE